MLEYFPFVPLGGHVRIGVAIVSYDGALDYGVTGDYERPRTSRCCATGSRQGLRNCSRPATRRARRRRAEDLDLPREDPAARPMEALRKTATR